MYCKRCRVKMRLSPSVHHKKRKWICPRCGRARMEGAGAPGRATRRKERSRQEQ